MGIREGLWQLFGLTTWVIVGGHKLLERHYPRFAWVLMCWEIFLGISLFVDIVTGFSHFTWSFYLAGLLSPLLFCALPYRLWRRVTDQPEGP